MNQPCRFIEPGVRAIVAVLRSIRIQNQPWRRKLLVGIVKIVDGQSDLLQVIQALSFPSGSTRGLDCGQKNRDQNSNDCNHHEKFDQREACLTMRL